MVIQEGSPPPVLKSLDVDHVERVLVVVAHPDDAEYGVSAAVAMWTEENIEVGYLLVTAGEAGMQRPPIEARKVRAAEQRAACDIVGVDHLQILDFPDGLVEYGIELRKAIAYEIRAFKPDVVITGSGDLQVGWGLDHADHRAVGLASVDAVRDAGNQWLFTEQFHDGLRPWNTETILLTGTDPTHFVEVSDSAVEKAVASLAAHREYLADLPDNPVPEDFVPEMLQEVGTAAGVPYAMGFAKY